MSKRNVTTAGLSFSCFKINNLFKLILIPKAKFPVICSLTLISLA